MKTLNELLLMSKGLRVGSPNPAAIKELNAEIVLFNEATESGLPAIDPSVSGFLPSKNTLEFMIVAVLTSDYYVEKTPVIYAQARETPFQVIGNVFNKMFSRS